VRLSTRPSTLLHDLAAREQPTLSETIERYLPAVTLAPTHQAPSPIAEQPPVQKAAARTGAPKTVHAAVAPQKRSRAFVTIKKGVWYATVHFAPLPPLDTRPDQCPGPHRRADAGLGHPGAGSSSPSPEHIAPASPGYRGRRRRPWWAWPWALSSRGRAGHGHGETGGPAVGCRHTPAPPPTVSMAKAAIRAGFSRHTGPSAAGCLRQRKPGATGTCCA
jgi:hypothetical protein